MDILDIAVFADRLDEIADPRELRSQASSPTRASGSLPNDIVGEGITPFWWRFGCRVPVFISTVSPFHHCYHAKGDPQGEKVILRGEASRYAKDHGASLYAI